MRYAQHITVGEQQNGSGTPHRWGVLLGGGGGVKKGGKCLKMGSRGLNIAII